MIVESAGGRPKLLMTLNDWTGGYGIVMVDPYTGGTDFFEFPFTTDDSPFAVLYSRKGLLYNQFGNQFAEFDPRSGKFTFVAKTTDRDAMMMTEDDKGIIWMATYPKAHLMSFNPSTREFKEYGSINEETWPQYPRSLAVDDAGWVYAGICVTRGQIVAFDPATGTIKKIVPEEERTGGSFDIRSPFHSRSKQGTVWRATDGKVYARMPESLNRPWFRLYRGEVERVENVTGVEPLLEVAGSQFLFQGKLPDGGEISDLDVPNRSFTLLSGDSTVRKVRFDYPSKGARIASMGLGPDDRIYGATGHPLQFYAIDLNTGKIDVAEKVVGGHINAITSFRGRVYGAIYTQGILITYDPAKLPNQLTMNELARGGQDILRPFSLIGHSKTGEIIMAGSPGYGLSGGGLLFYNVESGKTEIINHTTIIPDQCTKALLELPDGTLLGATSIEAGTGGQPVAKVAEMYIMEMPSRKIVWREAALPRVPQYRDLLLEPRSGLVFGLAGTHGYEDNADFYLGGEPLLFVFNPATRKVVYQENLYAAYGGLTGGQAPRVMKMANDGMIYILFQKAIVRLNPQTMVHEKVADVPVPVHTGIAIVNNTLVFSSGSEIWGYRLKNEPAKQSEITKKTKSESASAGSVAAGEEEVLFQLQNGSAGYEGAADTMIIAGASSEMKNFGSSPSILIGAGASTERRALLRFDLSRLTDIQSVKSATLQLTQVNTSGFKSGVFEIGLFTVAPGNSAWKPGRGNDAVAQEGESSWKSLSGGGAPTAWAGTPGLGREGVDFQAPAAVVFKYDTANNRQTVSISLPPELIQQWINNPESNAGLLIKKMSGGAEALGGFMSSDHSSGSVRPRLVIKATRK